MNEKKITVDEEGDGKIPFRDKRRFNADGEFLGEEEKLSEPVKSPNEAALEARLTAETERREAAESKLVGVQARFEEAKRNLERETAEMRERLKKTLEDRARQDQFNFLVTLLPVLDNLNRAIAASETDPSIEHLRDGVIGTARSFERALLDVGVEPIAAVGEKFDPELHEAVDMVPADPDNDGRVVTEYSSGYRFRDKLLRPARVQVGKAKAGSAAE
jgi:molecular chaperone GrpE